MPFVQVRVQLWLRELRRVVCNVAETPQIRFANDLTDTQLGNRQGPAASRRANEAGHE